MDKKAEPVFSAFAVSLTGNRGAVSMLESAIDHLTSLDHHGYVNVFTVYPKEDKKIMPIPRVSVFDGTPINLICRIIPLAMLYRLLTIVGIKVPKDFFGKAMEALITTDVCLMIGGTTFTDAQPIKIFYNVLCLLPAIIMKKKSMMYSQTMGPFNSHINRYLARWAFSKMDFIVPRGQSSYQNVAGLNLKTPFENFADSAFTLQVPEEIEDRIYSKYKNLIHEKKVVGISMNSIVQEKCELLGIDHDGAWVTLFQYLFEHDYFVFIIPHSMRIGSKSRHNNDLLVVDKIMNNFPDTKKYIVVREPYSCKELRAVVGLMDYYIASRFHSMISCLCKGVPVLVYGWGFQKYQEVMRDFGLEQYCHDASELTGYSMISGFEEIVRESESIKKKCMQNLPTVKLSSQKNHDTAWQLAKYEAIENT